MQQGINKSQGAVTPEEIAALEKEVAQLEGTYKSKIDLAEMVGQEKNKEDGPTFLSPSGIKEAKRNKDHVVKSGIVQLDKQIRGFNLGELSVWSGSNGSGKSSLLSQLALESINSNYNVALFSGELVAHRVLSWVQLQASGISHNKQTEYDNYYIVPSDIKQKINEWLEGKFYVYNNDKGSSVEKVIASIDECIVKNKIKVVIIDNLMALNLSRVVGEKYERQTNLVIALSGLAKKHNVHIHFVAHPRKSLGFLRKEDISGTADITNLADNVFIIHRVNNDFKRGIKDFLGKAGDHLTHCDNVIEVAKNRDLGISDSFISLYFEVESKRFLNYEKEKRIYEWEKDKDGFAKVSKEQYADLPFM